MRERQGMIPDLDTREQVIHSAHYYAEEYHVDIQACLNSQGIITAAF